MAVPCREFANIYVPVNQNPYYEPNIHYTNHTTTECNVSREGSPLSEPTNTHDRSQSAYSQSSQTSSIDYATCMEMQNGTWAEQMDIVEEGLNASIYAAYPIDPLSFTFSLNQST